MAVFVVDVGTQQCMFEVSDRVAKLGKLKAHVEIGGHVFPEAESSVQLTSVDIGITVIVLRLIASEYFRWASAHDSLS